MQNKFEADFTTLSQRDQRNHPGYTATSAKVVDDEPLDKVSQEEPLFTKKPDSVDKLDKKSFKNFVDSVLDEIQMEEDTLTEDESFNTIQGSKDVAKKYNDDLEANGVDNVVYSLKTRNRFRNYLKKIEKDAKDDFFTNSFWNELKDDPEIVKFLDSFKDFPKTPKTKTIHKKSDEIDTPSANALIRQPDEAERNKAKTANSKAYNRSSKTSLGPGSGGARGQGIFTSYYLGTNDVQELVQLYPMFIDEEGDYINGFDPTCLVFGFWSKAGVLHKYKFSSGKERSTPTDIKCQTIEYVLYDKRVEGGQYISKEIPFEGDPLQYTYIFDNPNIKKKREGGLTSFTVEQIVELTTGDSPIAEFNRQYLGSLMESAEYQRAWKVAQDTLSAYKSGNIYVAVITVHTRSQGKAITVDKLLAAGGKLVELNDISHALLLPKISTPEEEYKAYISNNFHYDPTDIKLLDLSNTGLVGINSRDYAFRKGNAVNRRDQVGHGLELEYNEELKRFQITNKGINYVIGDYVDLVNVENPVVKVRIEVKDTDDTGAITSYKAFPNNAATTATSNHNFTAVRCLRRNISKDATFHIDTANRYQRQPYQIGIIDPETGKGVWDGEELLYVGTPNSADPELHNPVESTFSNFTNRVLSELKEYPSYEGISTSEREDLVYDMLKDKYGEVKRQYKDEDRYPWECDFYIPSEDMFIEYDEHWTHHFVPYDPENPEHEEEVKKLKAKHNEFYDRVVDIWTRLDPEKKQTAKDNGIDLKVFYSMPEFENWFYDKGEVIKPRDFDYYTSKANGTAYGLKV